MSTPGPERDARARVAARLGSDPLRFGTTVAAIAVAIYWLVGVLYVDPRETVTTDLSLLYRTLGRPGASFFVGFAVICSTAALVAVTAIALALPEDNGSWRVRARRFGFAGLALSGLMISSTVPTALLSMYTYNTASRGGFAPGGADISDMLLALPRCGAFLGLAAGLVSLVSLARFHGTPQRFVPPEV